MTEQSCGCRDGLNLATPVVIDNPPGLSAIANRVGTHARFKRSLLTNLTASRASGLQELKTRADDDFAIAILDSWATVADILSFYQERIANESYLRTATERGSILELARLIGYELRPGVAVEAALAFTVEGGASTPGAPIVPGTAITPGQTTIPAGTRVMSIPGAGETARTFETIETIPGRAIWNTLRPRLSRRHPIAQGMDRILAAGLETGLRVGDRLFVVADRLAPEEPNAEFLKIVTAVTPRPQIDPNAHWTEVQLLKTDSAAPVDGGATGTPPRNPNTGRASGDTTEFTTLFLQTRQVRVNDLNVIAQLKGTTVAEAFANLAASQPPPPAVTRFHVRAALFGHNAPDREVLLAAYLPENKPAFLTERENSWAEMSARGYSLRVAPDVTTQTLLFLDTVYPGIVRHDPDHPSYVVLIDADGSWARYEVAAVTEVSHADFTLAAKVTRLTLNGVLPEEKFALRTTTVYARSEPLPLARKPITEPLPASAEVDLDTWVDGLYEGQRLIVCGELEQDRGIDACEVVTIKYVEAIGEDRGFPRLHLAKALTAPYVRGTVTIRGNVARATHGETKQETLGSGDGSKAFQRFVLRQPPLTYISAATPSGSTTTLEVFVNDVRWHEVPSLFGAGPHDRVYTTSFDDTGMTTIQFGDGRTGARLPTGQENVRAVYRSGSGLAAHVRAEQLSLLMTRPASVSGVVNPRASEGGDDPERIDDARQNAPSTVVTLDRIVSLRDYEDFARTFAGVRKAYATWTWDGWTRGVFLTVAGPEGAEIAPDSNTRTNLIKAVHDLGDPSVPIRVESFTRQYFRVQGSVTIDRNADRAVVAGAIENAMRDRFSFDNRDFGQAVTRGEVIAVVQNVPGVTFVDIDVLFLTVDPVSGDLVTEPVDQARLDAHLPLPRETAIHPAALIVLDPRPVELEVRQ